MAEELTRAQRLKLYEESVEIRIKRGIGGLFPNADSAYTIAVVRQFLKAAQKTVRLYCGSLNPDVYALLHNEFKEAIERGVDVRVATQRPYNELTKEAQQLVNYLISKGRWMHTPSTVEHFMVVDDVLFRLETNMETKEAAVCAYAPAEEITWKYVQRLSKTFEQIWKGQTVTTFASFA